MKGKTYGRLTTTDHDKMVGGVRMVKCSCECGNTGEYRLSDLKSGNTRSCGCLFKETRQYAHRTHGKGDTRLYSIWTNMKTRCNNKNTPTYEYYGRRGIRLSKEWDEDFRSFYDWAIENGYRETLTIERLDCNGNYEPSNCTWIKRSEQNKNRRNNIIIDINGESSTLRDWCIRFGLVYKNVHQYMLRKNQTAEKTLRIYMEKKGMDTSLYTLERLIAYEEREHDKT